MSGLTQTLQAASGWLALVALVLGLIALLWVSALQRRVQRVTPDTRRLIRDMEGKNLAEVVQDLLGNMEFLSSRLGRLQVTTEDLARSLRGTLQHQGLVRYNADTTVGGELSFALALLDGDRNGVLLTCLHTLDDCRLYLRAVESGTCAHDLSDEEAEALDVALQRKQPEPDSARRMRRTRWREHDPRRSRREPSTDK